jgi:hypothetical protein
MYKIKKVMLEKLCQRSCNDTFVMCKSYILKRLYQNYVPGVLAFLLGPGCNDEIPGLELVPATMRSELHNSPYPCNSSGTYSAP